MLYLALLHGKKQGRRALVYAGRNAHKTFLSAAALLDLDVEWLYGRKEDSYLCCRIEAASLDAKLGSAEDLPFAVYITSPDYLGNTADVRALAEVCRRHGVLLLVDNAHGAYLRFLPESRHPMDLGADMCCASAHKTLPVITGGAYLHISKEACPMLVQQARNALALFGSTSPSYLIMQSLDAANARLGDAYKDDLAHFCREADLLREKLEAQGYLLSGDEPLKITINAKPHGYTGTELSAILLEKGIVSEFADPDFVVFMLTPETGTAGLDRLGMELCSIPRKDALTAAPAASQACKRALSIREALFSESEPVPVQEACGRVLAAATVGCPPAVPIVVCGERIDAHALECFRYYGIENCCVVKDT